MFEFPVQALDCIQGSSFTDVSSKFTFWIWGFHASQPSPSKLCWLQVSVDHEHHLLDQRNRDEAFALGSENHYGVFGAEPSLSFEAIQDQMMSDSIEEQKHNPQLQVLKYSSSFKNQMNFQRN